jgi:excisionase family DNA binding protein
MTLKEVAQYLHLNERTVYKWAHEGTNPGSKLSRGGFGDLKLIPASSNTRTPDSAPMPRRKVECSSTSHFYSGVGSS